jgi:glycosyltransferase involved in cell wall biosynthesis
MQACQKFDIKPASWEGTMDERKPLITIGMPVYNGEKYLTAALDSLSSQDYKDIEILILDNASTDNTRIICSAFTKKDPRIKYQRNEKNIGIINNFNRVLQMSDSEYFMWAAYDDLWAQTFVSTLLEVLEKHKDAVLAFPSAIMFDDLQAHITDHQFMKDYPILTRLSSKNQYDRMKLYLEAGDGKSNMTYGLMRTSLLKKTGGFQIRGFLDYAPDLWLLFDLLRYGEIISCEKTLFFKRITDKKEKDDMKSRIHRFVFFRLGRVDLFFGYLPIIKNMDAPSVEKFKLAFFVFVNFFRGIGYAITNMIFRHPGKS